MENKELDGYKVWIMNFPSVYIKDPLRTIIRDDFRNLPHYPMKEFKRTKKEHWWTKLIRNIKYFFK